MPTTKKSPTKSQKKSATKSASNSSTKKSTVKANPCWPGYEPVPGKKPRTKGSCKPEPGPHSKVTRRATQRAAAASKLEKETKK